MVVCGVLFVGCWLGGWWMVGVVVVVDFMVECFINSCFFLRKKNIIGINVYWNL